MFCYYHGLNWHWWFYKICKPNVGPTLFAKLTLTLKLAVSSVHWSQLTLMVNLQHWPNVGPTLFSLLTLTLKLDVSRVHWHNVGRTLFSQLTLVSTYIDGRFTTLTQCWPDFVCQTNIDTQVICKCTLTQCLPNIVFLLALTLKLTVSSEHWPNVGPTLCYQLTLVLKLDVSSEHWPNIFS